MGPDPASRVAIFLHYATRIGHEVTEESLVGVRGIDSKNAAP